MSPYQDLQHVDIFTHIDCLLNSHKGGPMWSLCGQLTGASNSLDYSQFPYEALWGKAHIFELEKTVDHFCLIFPTKSWSGLEFFLWNKFDKWKLNLGEDKCLEFICIRMAKCSVLIYLEITFSIFERGSEILIVTGFRTSCIYLHLCPGASATSGWDEKLRVLTKEFTLETSRNSRLN